VNPYILLGARAVVILLSLGTIAVIACNGGIRRGDGHPDVHGAP
jgi:hypothetical protein